MLAHEKLLIEFGMLFKENSYILDKERYLQAYKQMLLVRKFEEKSAQFYGMGLIRGFCHLYIGQEAVALGFMLARNSHDSVVTSYRDHVHGILSGLDPKFVMAELCGKVQGCSKGRGGSMHMFNKESNFYGGHGIVGAQTSIGTGLAFADYYLNTSYVSFVFLGDGAVNQGQFYESLNIASLLRLPVIYIIENNQYSMGTSVKRSTYMDELYKKGLSFGIEGVVVDGMDLEQTYNAAACARDFVIKKKSPLIVECKTYRYKGHSMSDPAKYRTKEELQEYRALDPITKTKNSILDKKYATQNELKNLEKEIKDYMRELESFVENSTSLPDEDNLYDFIFK